MSHSIDEINQLEQAAFIDLLGAIYEETPEIAKRVWRNSRDSPSKNRPFNSLLHLHQKMAAIVERMTLPEQLALIRAHPELGASVKMAEASVREQAGAGLNQMSETERERIEELNAAYQSKFGFPFVMAVKGFGKEEILMAFEERLRGEGEEERERAIAEINKIARLRLEELIEG